MDEAGVGFDDPTLIDPLSAILNDLAENLDGDPITLQELLQSSQSDLGASNVANITNAMDYFRCIENNKCYDKLDFVDYLINITEFRNYHINMGTVRVSDQLKQYKERLLQYKEYLRTQGVDTDKNFVGRTKDIETLVQLLADETHSCRGVCICGLGGMGKTSLANEVCYRLLKSKARWKIIRIDLRERDSLLDLLSLSLGELQETFSSTDIADMSNKLLKAILSITRRTILLFDNIDGILKNKNNRSFEIVLQFFDELLQKLDDNKFECKVKILITSRQKLIPEDRILQTLRYVKRSQTRLNDLLMEVELKPLSVREAMQLYQKCVDEKFITGDKVAADIVEFCGYCPLPIRSCCSAINSGLVKPQVLRYNLKIAAEKGGLTHQLQVESCLEQTFGALDEKFQKKLVRLTVFQTAKFDLEAASLVLGEAQFNEYNMDGQPLIVMQSKMDLLTLKTRHFIEIMNPDDHESDKGIDVFNVKNLKYSIHPLVYMYLKELVKEGIYETELEKARIGFVQYFERLLLKIGKEMDKNCMRAWKLIDSDKKHLINLFKGYRVQDTDENPLLTDTKERILLCTQMVLIGNLLLGDFNRVNFIEKMIKQSEVRTHSLKWVFWKIEKANWFFDLDRNELAEKILRDIEVTSRDIVNKGAVMAPVFGIFFFLKGKLSLKRKKPEDALRDLSVAQKLFNEHRFVRHNYLYHITNVYEKIALAYLMLEPPNLKEAFDYLSAAFKKATEKAENFYNLDIPSFTANIGRCYYLKAIQEKEMGNSKNAKEDFSKSLRYYTKALALDTQMNLHKYDNYADKLIKRAETHVELGMLHVDGALSDAVKDVKEADDLRRRILQPPNYKVTHTPHLVAKFLCIKAKQEYMKKQKGDAINHLWEAIMFFEITCDMIKIGGLHPIETHQEEYEEIKKDHFWALQQAREKDKIPKAIKFYNDFEAKKFERERKRAMNERETIQNSEFIPIEDLKAEIMMGAAAGGQMIFEPVEDESDSDENIDEDVEETVSLEDYRLRPDEVLDFDKLFIKMDHPDSPENYPLSEEDETAKEMEVDENKDENSDKIKSFDSLIDMQKDIDQISSKSDIADLTDDVFDDDESGTKEDTVSDYLSNMRRKSVESRTLSSLSSLSTEQRREKFQKKRSRDMSMQKFLDELGEETSEKSRNVLLKSKSSSKDEDAGSELRIPSFDMTGIEYLSIVDTDDKGKKKKLLRQLHEKYRSVQEEPVEETPNVTDQQSRETTRSHSRRKRQLQRSQNSASQEQASNIKASKGDL